MFSQLGYRDHTDDMSVVPLFLHIPRSNRNLRHLPDLMGKLIVEPGNKSMDHWLSLHSLCDQECDLPLTSSTCMSYICLGCAMMQ